MKILQGGSRGFYQTSGFKQIVNNNPHNLLSIKLSDGSDLVDDKNYIFVTTQFLMNGGDDFGDVLKFYKPRNKKLLGTMVSVYERKLIELKVIRKNTLIDKKNPRLKIL